MKATIIILAVIVATASSQFYPSFTRPPRRINQIDVQSSFNTVIDQALADFMNQIKVGLGSMYTGPRAQRRGGNNLNEDQIDQFLNDFEVRVGNYLKRSLQ